jgi:A/G-specific adenine glycosylase
MNKFSGVIINWYKKHQRDLPWRNTSNPYFIWLSEIILQQTRVDQGMPYYYKFIESFPTIQELANASQDEVLRLWQGLGYYSRGRNLHATAQQVVNNYDGNFPTAFNDLIKLKGIGNYTASAISSFCANENKAVVDGNVYRVLSRYFGIESDISLINTQKEFQNLASQLLNKKNPGLHNQAIMEFGAMQCVPKNPNCSICPLINNCFAFANKKISLLPYKSKKLKIKARYFNYIVLRKSNDTFISRRKAGDIWEGLYEFPLIETQLNLEENELLNSEALRLILNNEHYEIASISKQYKHQLTHQTIYCKFYEIKIKRNPNEMGLESVKWNALDKYPKPILIQRYIMTI